MKGDEGRPTKAVKPTDQIKDIGAFLEIARKAAHKLSCSTFNVNEYAPTPERYIEMVRALAETDYPYWRERMNWSFRAIRGVLADRTEARRLSRRRAPHRRKVSA